MSRKRNNKRARQFFNGGSMQGYAHFALMLSKFEELGIVSMLVRTQCPHCEGYFAYGYTDRCIEPDHQYVQVCPYCAKHSVKKIGKGVTADIRRGGII